MIKFLQNFFLVLPVDAYDVDPFPILRGGKTFGVDQAVLNHVPGFTGPPHYFC